MTDYGISINSKFSSDIFKEISRDSFSVLELDGSLLETVKAGALKKAPPMIYIKNLMPLSLCNLILSEHFKLRSDFLKVAAGNFQKAAELHVEKVSFSFEVFGILNRQDEELEHLIQLLQALYGCAYQYDIELNLDLRIPGIPVEFELKKLAEFLNFLIFPVHFSLDIHMHEGSFKPEKLTEVTANLFCSFDTIRFIYEPEIGNKFNAVNAENLLKNHLKRTDDLAVLFSPQADNIGAVLRYEIPEWKKLMMSPATHGDKRG